jgi:AraC-like DNA-binding protein
MNDAKSLLTHDNYSIKHITFGIGFEDVSNFLKKTGVYLFLISEIHRKAPKKGNNYN